MKSKHTPAKKTAEEVKKISQYFCNPSHSSPRDDLSMDWSEDIPEAQSSPTPCASPAGEHVSSPQVPLSNSVKSEEVRLDLFYFYFLLFIFFSIYFSIFYF